MMPIKQHSAAIMMRYFILLVLKFAGLLL